MTAPREIRLFVMDIIESIDLIAEYTAGLNEEEFYRSRMIQDAVIRRLEVIGEAVKAMPEEVRRLHPAIRWRSIAGMRDILIHDYFGIKIEIVWAVVTEEMDTLRAAMAQTLQRLERG